MIKKSNSQQIWIEVKRKYHLSETTIQMAKKLGLTFKQYMEELEKIHVQEKMKRKKKRRK